MSADDAVTAKAAESEEAARDAALKATVFLPKTDFPMRAGLPKREPAWLARWEDMNLYARQREEARNRPRYELHDGPPYANGHLHIGHALNKILKDVVVRSHQMLGHDSRYVPGWDCHGLPIEWKIEEQYRAKGQDKDAVPVVEFRRECREFADKWIDLQREEFKRLGVVGDWERYYTTMSYQAEAVIAEEFLKFVMNGSLYRGSKPVMWSPIEKTALAEAEVEYHEHESHTIWVRFPVAAEAGALKGADIVIWTTTPWTIPSNRGVAYHRSISYGLYEVTDAPEDNWAVEGDRLVIADALAEASLQKGRVEAWTRVCDVPAGALEGLICRHPLAEIDPFWGFDVPVLEGDFVTDEAGTGFVHVAPSHGADDFELFAKHGLLDRITHNVDAEGAFADHVPIFAGKRILKKNGKEGDANKAVIATLSDSGKLMARGKLKHSYPHSWRSKAPLIFRNTPQWFVALDKPLKTGDPATDGKTIRAMALKSVDADVRWVPGSGRNRLYSMIENRPDWVLSRQRAWGVPLCCFMKRRIEDGVEKVEILQDPAVNARIVAAFRAEGADAWFKDDAAERFLRPEHDPAEWEKVSDILDVWFDSGCTHAFVMGRTDAPEGQGGMWPASIYLEGTDQHRGWFHSSLLEGCGTRGRAPYDCVLTHGFALDENGQKMSKALGNGVAPQDVIKEYGADILRLWVITSDYTEDVRIGPQILKNAADSYRRLRNTLRFILGALDGYDPAVEKAAPEEMPELERWVLHRLAELDAQVRQGYRDFDYARLFGALFTFCTSDLSAFYFDIRKDALYCDAPDDPRRRACRTVMALIWERLTVWLAPMLPFTAEDVWLSRRAAEAGCDPLDPALGSVHLETIPDTPDRWRDASLAAKWDRVRRLRRVVTGALEIERREKRIGGSLEAAPLVQITDPSLAAALEGLDLAEICITSDAATTTEDLGGDAFRLEDAPGVAVRPGLAEGAKCKRCWRVRREVGTLLSPDLCERCEAVVRDGSATS